MTMAKKDQETPPFSILLLALFITGGGPAMSQTPNKVDSEFVASLKNNISGIYYRQVEDIPSEKITTEFRNSVQDSSLVADPEFMQNLCFLIRKRELRGLSAEVERLLAGRKLKPEADASAMKTLYALGNDSVRQTIDDRLSKLLQDWFRKPNNIEPSSYLDAAERIGGEKTLAVLKQAYLEATARQRQAERDEPNDHLRMGQLDKRRAELEEKVHTLSQKQEISAKNEAERAAEMTSLYIRRVKHLSYWGYKELADNPSPGSIAAVRAFLSRGVESLLSAGGMSPEDRSKRLLDYRLRGIGLLEAMKAQLSPEEQGLQQDHATLIESREEYFQPHYDWEDVLDRR
jgi:hypothetical protein